MCRAFTVYENELSLLKIIHKILVPLSLICLNKEFLVDPQFLFDNICMGSSRNRHEVESHKKSDEIFLEAP